MNFLTRDVLGLKVTRETRHTEVKPLEIRERTEQTVGIRAIHHTLGERRWCEATEGMAITERVVV